MTHDRRKFRAASVRKLMSGLLMRSSRQSAERPSANNVTRKMNVLTTYDSHFGGVVTRRSASAWVRDLVAATGLRRFRLQPFRLDQRIGRQNQSAPDPGAWSQALS